MQKKDKFKDLIHSMIRVDQAGEFGAKRIYEGQLAVMKKRNSKHVDMVQHMYEQELEHYETFNRLINERKVRPTAMAPLWHIAGFALGAGTAMLGDEAAMACTVAVEELIDAHYLEQLEQLEDKDPELKALVEKFRQEELEHRDIGYEHDAEKAPFYPLLKALIQGGSSAAIWLSKRI